MLTFERWQTLYELTIEENKQGWGIECSEEGRKKESTIEPSSPPLFVVPWGEISILQ